MASAATDAHSRRNGGAEEQSFQDYSARKQSSPAAASATNSGKTQNVSGFTEENEEKAKPGALQSFWAEYGLDWKGFVLLAK